MTVVSFQFACNNSLLTQIQFHQIFLNHQSEIDEKIFPLTVLRKERSKYNNIQEVFGIILIYLYVSIIRRILLYQNWYLFMKVLYVHCILYSLSLTSVLLGVNCMFLASLTKFMLIFDGNFEISVLDMLLNQDISVDLEGHTYLY